MKNIIRFIKEEGFWVLGYTLMCGFVITVVIVTLMAIFTGCSNEIEYPDTVIAVELTELRCGSDIGTPPDPEMECVYIGTLVSECEDDRLVNIWRDSNGPYLPMNTSFTLSFPESEPTDTWFYTTIDDFEIILSIP